MEPGRIVGTGGNLPIVAPQPKSGEEAFHQMARSRGNTAEELEDETAKRARLTRNVAGRRNSASSSLYVISDGSVQRQDIYRTVMVDGMPFTLRELAVA